MRRRRCAVQRPCLRELLFQLVPPLLVFGGALLHVGKVPAPGYFVNKRFELALALHLRLVIDKEAEAGIEDLLQVQRPHRQLQLLLGSQASQAENIVYTIKRDLQRLGLIWRRGRFGIRVKELDDAGCKQLFLVRLGHGECSARFGLQYVLLLVRLIGMSLILQPALCLPRVARLQRRYRR
jgi:hypothetical protein